MKTPIAAFLLLVLALAASPAGGQGGAPMFGEFIAESSDPISINADMLEWAQRGDRDVLEYSGNVIATRGDMIIRASRLTVFLPAGGAAADVTFDRIEASGNVSIVAGPQTVAAQLAVMDMLAQTVVMTGNVTLDDGANQMSGDRLTVDLATGGWQLGTGADRVRTIVNPGQ